MGRGGVFPCVPAGGEEPGAGGADHPHPAAERGPAGPHGQLPEPHPVRTPARRAALRRGAEPQAETTQLELE